MKDFEQNQDMDKTDQAKNTQASSFDHHLQNEFEVSIADVSGFPGLQNIFTANPNCLFQ